MNTLRLAAGPVLAMVAGVSCLLAVAAIQPASASGRSYHGGYSSYHVAVRGAGRRHYRGHRYARPYGLRFGYGRGYWRSGYYFSLAAPLLYAPIYTPRYAPAYREAVIVHRPAPPATVPQPLPNMPVLKYSAMNGQNLSTLTRDRQECERWAWRATRRGPGAATLRTVRTERIVTANSHGGDALLPVIQGAALGAAGGVIGGAIAGDAGVGAAVGAVVGATAGLLSSAAAPRTERVVQVKEYVPVAVTPDPRALRHALTECMRARNYTVQW